MNANRSEKEREENAIQKCSCWLEKSACHSKTVPRVWHVSRWCRIWCIFSRRLNIFEVDTHFYIRYDEPNKLAAPQLEWFTFYYNTKLLYRFEKLALMHIVNIACSANVKSLCQAQRKTSACVGVICNYSSQAIILRNPHDLIKFLKWMSWNVRRKKSVSTSLFYNVDRTYASDRKIANCFAISNTLKLYGIFTLLILLYDDKIQ